MRKFRNCRAFLILWLLAPLSSAPAEEAYRAQRLYVSGSPEEIGRAVGRKYGPPIRRLHAVALGVAQFVARKSQRDYAARMEALAKKMAPEDVQEIRGVAKGAGMRFEDALFVNLFYELTAPQFACRQLVAWGKATADGELIHARNLDWFDYPGRPLQKHNLILNVRPRRGIEYMILTWPGFQGAITGLNRRGLILGFNQIPGKAGADRVAEPVFFTMKRVLRRCATVEEATQEFKKARPLGNGAIMISDSNRKTAVVVEIYGGQVGVRKAKGEMIAAANHATREVGLRGAPTGPADWPACVAARDIGLPLTVAKMEMALKDKRVLQDINILSVVFAPSRNRMRLSCGRWRAARGKYFDYSIFRRPVRSGETRRSSVGGYKAR